MPAAVSAGGYHGRPTRASFSMPRSRPFTGEVPCGMVGPSIIPTGVAKADSTVNRNTVVQEDVMATSKGKSERSTRSKLHLPGRPPVWRREYLCRFWRAVELGLSSENAAVDAGVSGPVGMRWFRSSGGMPPAYLSLSAKAISSRCLTIARREEIALELARGTAIRAIARKLDRPPSTISREIRRNAATRVSNFVDRVITAQWYNVCTPSAVKNRHVPAFKCKSE